MKPQEKPTKPLPTPGVHLMTGVRACHPDPELLRQFGLGQLTDEQAEMVERHVSGCDLCTISLQQVEDDSLVGLVRNANSGGQLPAAVASAATVGKSASASLTQTADGPLAGCSISDVPAA